VTSFLLYLSLGFMVLWTARLAQSKMRNPWLWGGAALILMLVPPSNLLGMVHLVVILVLKNPQQQRGARPETDACPKCRTPQPQHSRFCTNCGWELGANYLEESASDKESPLSTPSAANPQPINMPESPAAAAKGPEPALTIDRTPARSEGTLTEKVAPQETVAAEQSIAAQPVPRGLPTAASMTERGVRLFNQGRTQESIDQFTKAIALDPNYVDAWARRAEAYARLGRGAEAAEDQRRIDALNAGSAGG
jgi:tetratricopeptide (TPR) repeat protein